MEMNSAVAGVLRDIIEACSPNKVILISQKLNTRGELVSFKLCVVVNDVESTSELEGELYLKTDSEIPFDILIYNQSEWNELIDDECSFAGRINHSGVVIYE